MSTRFARPGPTTRRGPAGWERRCAICGEFFLLDGSSDQRELCPDDWPEEPAVEELDVVEFMERVRL
jgi:hypothetical protein